MKRIRIAQKRFDPLKEKWNKNKAACTRKSWREPFREGMVEESKKDVLLFITVSWMPPKAVLRPDPETTGVRIVLEASSKEILK